MIFTDTERFKALAISLRGDIVLPADAGYNEALKRWSTLAELPAQAVIYVKDAADIALVVRYVVEADVPFAIKCGGHSPSGASSSDGGIVIDLSRYLNSVDVDVDAKVVTIGGGALWRDVDAATAPFELGTVGGTINHTGVGGLLLGGGFGYLSGLHGLAVDNIIEVTMVIADGSLVKASETENPDLFWAVRGAGDNFGVVTEFRCRAHSVPPLCWGGRLTFAMDKIHQVYETTAEWQRTTQTAREAVFLLLCQGPGPDEKASGETVTAVCSHIGPGDVGKSRFAAFYALGPLDDFTSEKPYHKLNETMNHVAVPGRAYYMSAADVFATSGDHALRISAAQASAVQALPGVESHVYHEVYHRGVIAGIASDATAFAQRDMGNGCQAVTELMWNDAILSLDQVRSEQHKIVAVLEQRDVHKAAYPNYQSSVLEDDEVRLTYGGNYPRLQAIKAKYDPDMTFGKWFPIRPATHV